jgi:hypothetical protein
MQIRRLAGDRFEWLSDGQLVPDGARVPLGILPDGNWVALSQWLCVDLAPASFAGAVTDQVALSMVRSDRVHQANVMLASKYDLLQYVETAPSIRLKHLTFAMSNDNQVIVCGDPLPSIPGTRYAESEGVAVECGWTWAPAVDVQVLRELYRLQENDLLLLHSDASWDRIGSDEFVNANRSAVRTSIKVDRHA